MKNFVKEEPKLEIFSRLYACTCSKENGLTHITWNVLAMHRNVSINIALFIFSVTRGQSMTMPNSL